MHRVPQLSRRSAILTGALVLLSLLGYASWVRLREPRYQGKRVSYWFQEFCDTVGKREMASLNYQQYVGPIFNVGPISQETERESAALKALRSLGQPITVFLTDRVASASLGSTSVYGRIYAKLPLVIRRVLPNPALSDKQRLQAVVALKYIGAKDSSVGSVVSSYIQEQAPASYCSSSAIALLPYLRPSPEQLDELTTALFQQGRLSDAKAVIGHCHLRSPAVVKCIGEILEKEGISDTWSFLTLRELGPDAFPVTPLLLRLVTSTNAEMRYQSVRTLETIGPRAAEAIPALQACATDSSSMVRSAAKRAIEAIMGTNSVAR